jgi:hypothetical protein
MRCMTWRAMSVGPYEEVHRLDEIARSAEKARSDVKARLCAELRLDESARSGGKARSQAGRALGGRIARTLSYGGKARGVAARGGVGGSRCTRRR